MVFFNVKLLCKTSLCSICLIYETTNIHISCSKPYFYLPVVSRGQRTLSGQWKRCNNFFSLCIYWRVVYFNTQPHSHKCINSYIYYIINIILEISQHEIPFDQFTINNKIYFRSRVRLVQHFVSKCLCS